MHGNAYELQSPNHGQLMDLFESFCREHSILYRPEDCFSYLNVFPDRYQQINFLEP